MSWKKLGRIFCVNANSDWMYTHSMIPIAEDLGGGHFRVYFSCRDRENRGHGAFFEFSLDDPRTTLRVSGAPVLCPGNIGCFDDSGAIPNCIVEHNGEKLLYYTGINLGVTVKIRNSIGIARWDKAGERFEKLFHGPIIDRDRNHPHFCATPEVLLSNGKFRAWFSSCSRWELVDGDAKHYYRIEYAVSDNGIDWRREGVAIDFKDDLEYALGVPRVRRSESGYEMWFCSRADEKEELYRMRYAVSDDSVNWVRNEDPDFVVHASESGWDSEMICYPFIFFYQGKKFMLYNGNGYGLTGIGLAEWV